VEEINPVPETVSVCAEEPARTPVGETDLIVGAGLFAGATGGGAGELGEGELLPPQPSNKERVKQDPTKSRTLRRTSPPRKTKRSFRRTTSGGRRLKPHAALFYRKRFDSIEKLLRCLVLFIA
jgi:hypothetical protein